MSHQNHQNSDQLEILTDIHFEWVWVEWVVTFGYFELFSLPGTRSEFRAGTQCSSGVIFTNETVPDVMPRLYLTFYDWRGPVIE